MKREKQPHWMLVAFGTAVVTALVNHTSEIILLLWGGMVHVSWSAVAVAAVSVVIESILLFGVFVLGIRYTIVAFGKLILALVSREPRKLMWTDPLEKMVWKVAALLMRYHEDIP